MWKDYKKYCVPRKNKRYSEECHSIINLPLFVEDSDISVLRKIVIPELHFLQGFVNHLFRKDLVVLLCRDKSLFCPEKFLFQNITMVMHLKGMQVGLLLKGNCRQLLNGADRFEDPEFYNDVAVFKIIPYISAFKAMNTIVNCCSISGKVGSALHPHIEELQKALKEYWQRLGNIEDPYYFIAFERKSKVITV